MRIAAVTEDSIVDGEGMRLVVFTQGCPRSCPDCHNPQSQPFDGGTEVTVDELFAKIRDNPLCDGLTLSGGEPFAQAVQCAELAKRVKEIGKNVWTYTGYTLENLQWQAAVYSVFEVPQLRPVGKAIGELLSNTDVLVDGEFILAQKSLQLKWKGSSNQRIWEQYKIGEWRIIG
ncbi:MAG: anaerobic ribonucleoside-triphosphate reductase activating protein [Oscillospiraceae bacterium]|nr:anaerobic ribonucleoside-triphosphate reductase activating protein [Oscillospiraceae bacterium]